MTNINWTGSPRKQTAVEGDYTLLVIILFDDVWLYIVEFEGKEICSGNTMGMDRAKGLAVFAMKQHKKAMGRQTPMTKY